MNRAAISIAAGEKTQEQQKTVQKTGKQKRGRRNAAYFWFWFRDSVTLSEGRARSEETRRYCIHGFIKTRNMEYRNGRHSITDTGDSGLLKGRLN